MNKIYINDDYEIKFPGCNSLSELAEKINTDKDYNKDCILFINLNFKFKTILENKTETFTLRTSQTGIQLLKWLRLLEINNHCLLYSFQALSVMIKENPLNSILLSKGVTFIHAPFLESEIKIKEDELAKKENLLPFFRAEVDLSKIRHELANEWGVERINTLLDIKENKQLSYLKELLKFLTPYNNKNEVDKSNLTKLIRNFNCNGKKIFYFDDKAEDWLPSLQKLFGKNNIEGYSPNNTSQSELITLIEKNRPGCLLLDLRLSNEREIKNVLEYSGGQLLVAIKKKFISLPVIMFTASNKAESLRQLMAAGAEYVWTKEGIDDGINNELTLYNTINLINEVHKCIVKYKNETYELIYKTESKLSKIHSFDSNLLTNITTKKLKHVSSIFIDTNYLIDSIKYNSLDKFYNLLLTNEYLFTSRNKKRQMKIVIHSDIFRELYNISKQDENYVNPDPKKDRQNYYRVPVAKFLLEKLIQWRHESLIYEESADGQDETIKQIANYEIPVLPEINYLKDFQEEKQSFLSRVFRLFEEKSDSQLIETNNQINEINKKLIAFKNNLHEIPDFSRVKLHADITFQSVIPNALNYGGVIFVANDKECALNVGDQFDNNNYTDKKKRDYRKMEAINQGKPEIHGVYEAKLQKGNYFNIYQHLYSSDFNNLLTVPN